MKQRTTMAGAVAVITVLGLTACRGSEDDSGGGDEVATDDEAATDSSTDGESSGSDETSDSTADSGTAGGDESAAGSVECPESSPGLSDSSISLGGTYPLSGPAAAYSAIPVGIDTWFSHLNDTDGGLQMADGSTLEIEWNYLDDGYQPPRAVENVRQLVENDGVFAVLNPLGTPNNTAIRDYMNTEEVPQLLVATGASTWGKEIDEFPWTIGFQPDYESEGIAYAQYILDQNPDAQIGILYQNDDFGADYLAGIKEGLGDAVSQIVAEVSYEVTDTTIDNPVSQIRDAGADAYVIIATPQFAIQAIQRKAALGWEPPITIVSSVSSSVGAVMTPAGPENSEGIVTSAYLKDPTDPAIQDDEAIVQYKELLAQYHGDANPDDAFHVYGMNLAQAFEQLIEGMEGPLCRASLMEAVKNWTFEAPPLLVDGIGIETGPGDGFPIQSIQMKQFSADELSWLAVGDVVDTASAGGE